MQFLRRALAILLVFSLAATPVAAHVASATKVSGVSDMVNIASMPDCHHVNAGMVEQKSSSQKHCPNCEKDQPCSGDQCQYKCFKVMAALPRPSFSLPTFHLRYGFVQSTVPVPVNLTPQRPPPRA